MSAMYLTPDERRALLRAMDALIVKWKERLSDDPDNRNLSDAIVFYREIAMKLHQSGAA